MTSPRAQVEAQLDQVRARANARVLSTDLLGFGTALALVVATVVVAGMRLEPGDFRVVAWFALLLLVAGAAAAVWRIRRSWFSAERAAALADQSVNLQQRLATLAHLSGSERDGRRMLSLSPC